MQTEGGGWALVYNSVLGVNTLEFWNIPYAERLGQRGTPGIWGNYYDGSIYQEGRRYLDVIEDLRGKAVVALEATATGINTTSMRFESPSYVAGNTGVFNHQFGNGWSAPDHEGDALPGQNCSVIFGNVTQHYGDCWGYNLGSDADGPTTDSSVGPHLHSSIASSLGLVSDGTAYTRVRRISRFAKW